MYKPNLCVFGVSTAHTHTLIPLYSMEYFRDGLENLLGRIAQDYQLDHNELIGRYLVSHDKSVSPVSKKVYKIASPPRRTKGKGKTVEPRDTCDYTEQELQDCNVSCLKGLCKHHGLTQGGTKPTLVKRLLNPMDGKPKKRGGRKKKPEKPEEPKHNHDMDAASHDDCEACQVQGNILAPVTGNFEWEIEVDEPEEPKEPEEPEKEPEGAIDDRLNQIMADCDDDDLEVCSNLSDDYDHYSSSSEDDDEQKYMEELCEEE